MRKLLASLISLAIASSCAISPAFAAGRDLSQGSSSRQNVSGASRFTGSVRQTGDLKDTPTGLDVATELMDANADYQSLYMEGADSPLVAPAQTNDFDVAPAKAGAQTTNVRLDSGLRRSDRALPALDAERQDVPLSARRDLNELAMNPAAAPQAFDAAVLGIRPGGAHPFPEIGHDPRPEVRKFDSAFSLRIDPSKARGRRILSQHLNVESYPAWATGPAGAVILPGNPRDEASVETALRRFMADHPAMLQGLTPDDFAVSINKIEGQGGVPDMIYANFAQVHNDLLVEGSEIQFKVKVFPDQTVLLPVEAQVQPHITLNTDGALGPDRINAAVRTRLGISPSDWRSVEKIPFDRVIMRAGGQWRVMDVFMVPAKLTLVGVDVNTGESFAWDPRVNAGPMEERAPPPLGLSGEGTVAGAGVQGYGPNIPSATITELPLGYTEITTSAGTVYADKDGKFVVPGEPGTTVTISATLKGKTYEIRDKAVTEQMHVTTTAPAGARLKLVFPASSLDENRYAAAMLAYTINLTHDAAEAVLGKDIIGKTLGNANLDQTCNAHYEPWGENSVNGYRASSRCVNSSYVSVMAHEVGHKIHDYARKKFLRKVVTVTGVVQQKFSSLFIIDNAGLSEGHGDTYTHLVTLDPRVGIDFLKEGMRREIRNAEDPPHQYNPDEEPHSAGKPWEEFEWEVRKEMIRIYGTEKGSALWKSLIYPVIFVAKDVPDAIDNVILRDMQADGTVPHFDLLSAIAAKRGIHPKNPGKSAQTLAAMEAKVAALNIRHIHETSQSIAERFYSITGVQGFSMDGAALIVSFDTRENLLAARRAKKLPKKISGFPVRYEARGVARLF